MHVVRLWGFLLRGARSDLLEETDGSFLREPALPRDSSFPMSLIVGGSGSGRHLSCQSRLLFRESLYRSLGGRSPESPQF
jgi:hypothetical protein